jgi:hypothetical protein
MGGGSQRGGGARTGSAPVQNTKMVKADSAAVVNPVGTWAYTVESPQGGAGNIVITSENETLAGTISNARFNSENTLKDVTLNGNELSFSYEVNMGGNTMVVNVKGTINGDEFNGNMSVGQFGTFPINGKRSQ